MSIRFAAAAALALGLALGPITRADDKSDSKDKSSEMTIHGVVAGVTVEGETIIDYKTKKAVEAEAAFLTVVGMPGRHHDAATSEKEEKAGEKSTGQGHHRANVYQVWLTPRTKVCTCCDQSGKPCEKKECGLDKLQVGDRVEITFARRDHSASTAGANLSEDMKSKHGRSRIHSVDAQEITILPPMHGASASNDSKDRSARSGETVGATLSPRPAPINRARPWPVPPSGLPRTIPARRGTGRRGLVGPPRRPGLPSASKPLLGLWEREERRNARHP